MHNVTPGGSAADRGDGTPAWLAHPWVVALLGFALTLTLSWPRLTEIWQTGRFYDTDDAMRLVQVQDWLNGQGWFDLTAHRLNPPAGLPMHWSRIVDLPLGGLIRLFELFTDPTSAERLTRLVFPLGLQFGLLVAAAHLGQVLAGRSAAIPAVLLTALSGFSFVQFQPGRIDHHAPQILLLICMTGAMLATLSAITARRAILAAFCMALSLAISLENLPFIAVLVAVLPLVWLHRPDIATRSLGWFAAGLAVSAPLCLLATVPPSRLLIATPDAFSVAHLLALQAGAGGLAVLAILSDHPRPLWARLTILGLVGALPLALVAWFYPAGLRGPYGDMDPLLRRIWLDHVTEAQPLLSAIRTEPSTLTAVFGPIVTGLLGCVLAVRFEAGISRFRWVTVLALTVVGMAGLCWEIRVASSTEPLALFGGVWVFMAASEAAKRWPAPWGSILAVASLMPFAVMVWLMVPVAGTEAQRAAGLAGNLLCRDPAGFRSLAELPPGLVLAPIDDGSHLLAHTPMSVLAAPYHRNQSGNGTAVEAFLAAPPVAEAIVRRTGARYLALCPGETQISVLRASAPEGLAADLLRGQVPAWLRPLDLPDTRYRVYEVE